MSLGRFNVGALPLWNVMVRAEKTKSAFESGCSVSVSPAQDWIPVFKENLFEIPNGPEASVVLQHRRTREGKVKGQEGKLEGDQQKRRKCEKTQERR